MDIFEQPDTEDTFDSQLSEVVQTIPYSVDDINNLSPEASIRLLEHVKNPPIIGVDDEVIGIIKFALGFQFETKSPDDPTHIHIACAESSKVKNLGGMTISTNQLLSGRVDNFYDNLSGRIVYLGRLNELEGPNRPLRTKFFNYEISRLNLNLK